MLGLWTNKRKNQFIKKLSTIGIFEHLQSDWLPKRSKKTPKKPLVQCENCNIDNVYVIKMKGVDFFMSFWELYRWLFPWSVMIEVVDMPFLLTLGIFFLRRFAWESFWDCGEKILHAPFKKNAWMINNVSSSPLVHVLESKSKNHRNILRKYTCTKRENTQT